MIIFNLTSGKAPKNIILTSLKEKKEDQDIVIGPGRHFDTQQAGIQDVRINKSQELKYYEKNGLIKTYKDYEEMESDYKKNPEPQNKAAEAQKQKIYDEIECTYNLSDLEDLIENEKIPADIRQRAAKRLIEVTGSSSEENPELNNDGQSNIRV